MDFFDGEGRREEMDNPPALWTIPRGERRRRNKRACRPLWVGRLHNLQANSRGAGTGQNTYRDRIARIATAAASPTSADSRNGSRKVTVWRLPTNSSSRIRKPRYPSKGAWPNKLVSR